MTSGNIGRRRFFKRFVPIIALPVIATRAHASNLAWTLDRIWVSRPPWMGGLGLRALPAIPVDIPGVVESLFRLANRLIQTVPAKLGLSNEYTIQGRTATALEWMYGTPLDQEDASLRQRRTVAHLQERLAENRGPFLGMGSLSRLGSAAAGVASTPVPRQIHLDDPRQFSMAWTNFNDVYQNAKPWEEMYAASLTNVEAANAQFWPTLNAGSNGFNLLLPRKVARFATGTLYLIDLGIFRTVQPHVIDGIDRFTPATKTWLWQDAATKSLRPVLVQVSGYRGAGQQSFTPGDPAWLYALQAAKTSITVYGIWLGHVFHWHLVSGAMQMTLKQVLPAHHALAHLLAPQSKYNIAFNNILFLLWLEIGPPTSINGPDEFLVLCNEFAKRHTYFDNDPNTALRKLGLEAADFTVRDPWDQFPVVRRYLDIWDATKRYVGAVVGATYASDIDVLRDEALQSWIAFTRHRLGGNVKGLPVVTSRQTLEDVLASYLYRITVHGVSRFGVTVHPALSFASNFPPCLHKRTIPRPDTVLSTQDLLQYLPTTDTLGKYVDFLYFFIYSRPYERFVPDEGVDRELFFPGGLTDPRNAALVRYRLDILAFADRFDPVSVRASQWPRNIET